VFDVKSLLSVPSVRLGLPTVMAGASGLDAPVRWLHIGDFGNVAHYLHGGEVLLTNGIGFESSPEQRRNFVRSLAEVKAAALLLELGMVFSEVPPEIVDECEICQLPLIVMSRHVAFVDISLEVNSALVNQQASTLSRQVSLTRLFLDRVLEGANAAQLVELLSDQVGNPVVLRDQLRGIVAVADRGVPESELLLAQSELSEKNRYSVPLDGPKVADWRLSVLPLLSKLTEQDLLAIQEAARAISLLLTRGPYGAGHERWDPQLFLLDLLQEDASPSLASLRAAHLGFKGRFLVPFALFDVDEQIEVEAWHQVVHGLRNPSDKVLVTSLRHGCAFGVLGLDAITARASALDRLLESLRGASRQSGYAGHINLIVGDTHQTWHRTAVGLRDVQEAVHYAATRPIAGYYDASAPDVRRLVTSLASRHDFEEFVERILTPVMVYDKDRSSPLMPTLVALCRNGGRKTETAKELHIERSSLYDRLVKLERLLNLSFNDAEHFLSVQLAVIAHEEARASR